MADDDNSDDDLYGETAADQKKMKKQDDDASSGDEPMDEGADSGDDDDDDDDEEEEEDSESDIDIIIDKPIKALKPTTLVHTLPIRPSSANSFHHRQQQQQQPESKAIKIEDPSRQQSSTPAQASRVTTTGTVPQVSGLSGTAYPAQRTSNIDVDGNPVYPPVGKEILSVEIDADLAEEQKIWRKPGEDQSDYFNYGFDEFTWELYRQRQSSMASTLQQQKNDLAQMQQMMSSMPGMGGSSGVQGGNNAPPSAPSGPSGGGAPPMMPGGMNEESMAMVMQQMMQSGMDPSQMDFTTFMQMSGQNMNGFPGGPGGGNQPGGGVFQGNQGGVGGGGGAGGRGGRGRGRGGGW